MIAVRYIFQAFSVSAAVALSLLSISTGVFAGETNEIKTGVIPYGLDQAPEDVKLEGAKAGVQSLLNEIVGELTSPSTSRVFLTQTNHSSEEEIAIRTRAFEKLGYIGNASTIRVVASFLSDTTHPPSKPTDLHYVSYAEMAANALSQIVSNPPLTMLLSPQDKIRAWQQWWEQNKDKYP